MTRKVVVAFLVWGGLANLPFFLLSIFFWFSRWPVLAFLLLMFVALSLAAHFKVSNSARKIFFWIISAAFVCVTVMSILTLISLLFGLQWIEIIFSLPLLLKIDLTVYPLYIAFGFILAGSTVGFIYLSEKTIPQTTSEISTVSTLLLGLCVWDFSAQYSAINTASASNDAPFFSAVDAGGLLNSQFMDEERDLLIVVVEALGEISDKSISDSIFAGFDDPDLNSRYDITRGTVPFKGSTTAAEMRELCSSTSSYLNIVYNNFDASSCLPLALRQKGYDTISYHGFDSATFARHDWYPAIGFSKSYFAPQLVRSARKGSYGICGGVWKGLCDLDIGLKILNDMESAQGKTFTYWLTLNSHFPTRPTDRYGSRFPCEEHGLDRDNQICTMIEYWKEVFEATINIAMSERLRPTNIIIVGDHAPPLLVRFQRNQFVPFVVPFVALKYRGNNISAGMQNSASGQLQ